MNQKIVAENGELTGHERRTVIVYKNDFSHGVGKGVMTAPTKVVDYFGVFMGFGVWSEDRENGVANDTCVIVEKDDGTIKLMDMDMVRFVKDGD